MPRQTLFLVPDAPIALIDSSKFYQTANRFAMKAIRAKLTGADWCVWSYLQMLDPHGDRMKDIPNPQEIAKAIDLSVKQVKRSLHKLEELELYETETLQMRGRNLAGAAVKETNTKLSRKGQPCPETDNLVQERTTLSRNGQPCPGTDNLVQERTTLSKSSSETLTVQEVQIPHTLHTYSDLLNTLSEGMRESFEKFCKRRMEEFPFKIASKKSWLNKHGAEYLEEFKETYSEALVNPAEVTAPKTKDVTPDIAWLKQRYGKDWEAAAIHFGYSIPNSPAVEI